MFDADCPTCGRVLVGPRRIVDLRPLADGTALTFRCFCGEVSPACDRHHRARGCNQDGNL